MPLLQPVPSGVRTQPLPVPVSVPPLASALTVQVPLPCTPAPPMLPSSRSLPPESLTGVKAMVLPPPLWMGPWRIGSLSRSSDIPPTMPWSESPNGSPPNAPMPRPGKPAFMPSPVKATGRRRGASPSRCRAWRSYPVANALSAATVRASPPSASSTPVPRSIA